MTAFGGTITAQTEKAWSIYYFGWISYLVVGEDLVVLVERRLLVTARTADLQKFSVSFHVLLLVFPFLRRIPTG
jgi:hypothetical protein